MALTQAIETPYGIQANYHKVALVNIDWHNRAAHVELLSFVDADARQAGKQPLGAIAFDWQAEQFPFDVETNNVQQAYQKIKSLPGWEGAQDA